ncbi:MAG TPA: hypothetical protein VF950_19145 [Planctomycetota bacterium]
MEDRLTRIHALLGEGYALRAYGLAADAKKEYLAEEEVDPRLLGWLRYYEFKCLIQLEAWAEAVDLFRRPEPAPFHLPLPNAAWMHLAAADGAARLGRAEDVVRWAERAVELRRADGDGPGMAAGLDAACRLLERMGRSDLNTPFADKMIELGLRTGAESAVIEGVVRLLENYEAKARATVRRRLEKSGTLLPALRAPSAELALERLKRALP